MAQLKLYGCRDCNTIGTNQTCECGKTSPRIHLENEEKPSMNNDGDYLLYEKPSIGNEDVFDRIDRELQELRSQAMSHTMREILFKRIHDSEDKIKALEDKIFSVHDKDIRSIDNCHNSLKEKVKSLDSRMENSEQMLSSVLSNFEVKIKSLEDRIGAVDDKIKSLREDFLLFDEDLMDRVKSLEDNINKISNCSLPEAWDLHQSQIKHLLKENILFNDKIKYLEETCCEKDIVYPMIEEALKSFNQRLDKLESKEKIQFEHESKDQYDKRIGLLVRKNLRHDELKEKYDKAIQCLKYYGEQDFNQGNANRYLRELGEL